MFNQSQTSYFPSYLPGLGPTDRSNGGGEPEINYITSSSLPQSINHRTIKNPFLNIKIIHKEHPGTSFDNTKFLMYIFKLLFFLLLFRKVELLIVKVEAQSGSHSRQKKWVLRSLEPPWTEPGRVWCPPFVDCLRLSPPVDKDSFQAGTQPFDPRRNRLSALVPQLH